ncbi:MAG: nucleoside kinase [Bacteroidaceae bacterium]|nr:nucleoside kinase [Bacteroidaceae bacterium]
MLQIYCKNTQQTKEIKEGSTLLDVLDAFQIKKEYPIVSAKVNNVSQGLKFRVYRNRDVEFLDISDPSAMRVYTRSLCFLLCKAARDLFPDYKVHITHSIANGFYCFLKNREDHNITMPPSQAVPVLKQRMQEIVDENMPFHKNEIPIRDAINLFRERKMDDKVKLFETSGQVYTDCYTLGDTPDYYYGRLLPNAGYLKIWGLEQYYDGILLRIPDHENPNKLAEVNKHPKTLEVFAEDYTWNNFMGLGNVGDVNLACLRGEASELIQVSEALQEKKIVKIAEEINKRHRSEKPLKVVLISGPSSSGKTTFCKRISIQLKACGLHPISISTDDYFVNRVDTPLLPNGQYDFDNFETVDYKMLQNDVLKLMNGEEVEVPEYNFVTGKREYNGKKLKLSHYSILLIEGIHALNPRLTDQIPDYQKFRIFISTLTSISLDDHNTIPPLDNRLLRRIVRDYNKGAFSVRETIQQWPSVCKAEYDWISPYQENADMMFNSALLIELAVLRNHAEPILASVPKNCPEYSEAHRLLKFLSYFVPVPDNEIPPTSMLREFIGSSSFKY